VSAIDSPPEYQGRDLVADDFAAAVAQLTTSREPIAPVHANIKETIQRGNPLTPEFHIASAATAIMYPARYEFAGGSGSGGGGGGGGSGGDPDPDQPMNNNDPGDDAPDPPGAVGGQPAYNPDKHPRSLCRSPPNVFDGTRDKVLWFYSSALNAPGSPPGPSAPAVAAAAAATVTLAVAVLVRAHFRQLHRIHQTGRPHGY
jgi:hypothetical protein